MYSRTFDEVASDAIPENYAGVAFERDNTPAHSAEDTKEVRREIYEPKEEKAKAVSTKALIGDSDILLLLLLLLLTNDSEENDSPEM